MAENIFGYLQLTVAAPPPVYHDELCHHTTATTPPLIHAVLTTFWSPL